MEATLKLEILDNLSKYKELKGKLVDCRNSELYENLKKELCLYLCPDFDIVLKVALLSKLDELCKNKDVNYIDDFVKLLKCLVNMLEYL
jgi:hypothetical protein